ncbi:hypothetical protein DPMN_156272 [Dreissena polymorpha]|uniref:Uncharacterized protein n=1 Tax=Dreissena polymorpha TaxID=45954 RepID=A0A9D4JAP7_DREPO|nr:hypothetical protein DPMN_156272 [Dreissena polymorpha]
MCTGGFEGGVCRPADSIDWGVAGSSVGVCRPAESKGGSAGIEDVDISSYRVNGGDLVGSRAGSAVLKSQYRGYDRIEGWVCRPAESLEGSGGIEGEGLPSCRLNR